MIEKVLCPYCGELMKRVATSWSDGEWMRCVVCHSESPHVVPREVGDVANAALRRPMQKPLTLEELEQSTWQIPCWVEERGGDLFPEVLDRDSVGYFGRIDAAHDRPLIHYFKHAINKAWRCWATRPTDEERAAANWEIEEADHEE